MGVRQALLGWFACEILYLMLTMMVSAEHKSRDGLRRSRFELSSRSIKAASGAEGWESG